jgi:demethylmenaquinone methyltransferase / 2-methoxy-6-polyprenyl-1,4-benzoquinol methylase
MTLPSLDQKASYVNRMFADIAPRYDLMNRLMTGGQDVYWRNELIRLCELPPRGKLLDVGTGTGDIAYEALRQHPTVTAVGCDFTYEMMAFGRHKVPHPLAKKDDHRVRFSQGDALHLPFPDATFDAVTSGFLLRNVIDIDAALREQARVTKPGGRVICLETTPPSQALLGPFVRFHMFYIIPLLGRLISPNGSAYQYLPQSTTVFPEPDDLARKMERVGLKNVFYRKKMLGTVAIHVGTA